MIEGFFALFFSFGKIWSEEGMKRGREAKPSAFYPFFLLLYMHNKSPSSSFFIQEKIEETINFPSPKSETRSLRFSQIWPRSKCWMRASEASIQHAATKDTFGRTGDFGFRPPFGTLRKNEIQNSPLTKRFFKYIISNCVRCITMSTCGYNQDDLSYWLIPKKKL